MKIVDISKREHIKDQVREFLTRTYEGSSLAPTPENFEKELLDIVDDVESLGSFEAWKRRYDEQQGVSL